MSNNRLIVPFVAALSVSAWMGTETQAQNREKYNAMRGSEGIRLRLLAIDQVREALKLTDEQKPEVAKVAMTYRDEGDGYFGALQNLSEDERAKKFAEFGEKTKAAWEKCERILTSEQVDRVKQISRQARGVSSLDDEDVALALKLTDDQKKQLESIRDATQQEIRSAFRPGDDREAAAKKVAEIQKASDAKQMAVLTDEQKKEFKRLQGEKIELPEGVFLRTPRRQPRG
jgi:hypothetical protein